MVDDLVKEKDKAEIQARKLNASINLVGNGSLTNNPKEADLTDTNNMEVETASNDLDKTDKPDTHDFTTVGADDLMKSGDPASIDYTTHGTKHQTNTEQPDSNNHPTDNTNNHMKSAISKKAKMYLIETHNGSHFLASINTGQKEPIKNRNHGRSSHWHNWKNSF